MTSRVLTADESRSLSRARTTAARKVIRVKGYERGHYNLSGLWAHLASWEKLEAQAVRLCKRLDRKGINTSDRRRLSRLINLLEDTFSGK